MNMPGTKTNEAVLLDPETIEHMGSTTDRDDGPSRPPIFGHTEIVSLLKTLIELQTGKSMPRPEIPGHTLRLQRKIRKTHNAVAEAQARNRLKRERLERKRSQAS